MGAGKTTVLAEASDILALRDITHAAVDLMTAYPKFRDESLAAAERVRESGGEADR
jgi:hypothetical protein